MNRTAILAAASALAAGAFFAAPAFTQSRPAAPAVRIQTADGGTLGLAHTLRFAGVTLDGGVAEVSGSGGGVSSVTGTAPIISSGGATPAISCAAAGVDAGGCVTAAAQTFDGLKTFDDGIAFADGTVQTTAANWDDLLKRRITWDRNGGNSTTFTSSAYGPAAPTASGTATLIDDGSPDGWINYASSGTLGAQGGIKAYTLSRWNRIPVMKARVRTVDTAGLRMFVVISSGELTNVTLDGTYPSGTSEFAGLTFDSAYSPNWQCCSGTGDPLEYGCTDTGVAVVADTEYLIRVAVVPLASTTCTINGTTVVRTGSPPDPALNRNVGFLLAFYATTASVKNYQLNRFSLETY